MRRCYGCMREVETATCPHCGWSADRDNEFHQLPVGTVLMGKYTVGRVLGQGGFGITYLGWDAQQEQTVAVKEFYPGSLVNRENTQSLSVKINSRSMEGSFASGRDRFLREARALAKLKEVPQIVGIHDSFPENGTAYIVMEYIRGLELRKYVDMKGGRLDQEECFRILEPILRALETVHAEGLVHRDISPDNIMLDPMGGAKLLDFGAVRTVEHPDAEKDMTHSTETIVKHGFAPMEQYRDRGSLGPWTDEYALCATVYYCLTGRIPPDAMARAMEDEDLDWSGVPDLTPRRRKALERGMAVKAKDRYPDMRKLREALYGKDRPAPKPEEHKEEKTPVREAPKKERPPREEKSGTEKPKKELPKMERPAKEEEPPKTERPERVRREKPPKPALWKPILITAAVLVLIAAAVLIPDWNKEEGLAPAEPQFRNAEELVQTPAGPKETEPSTEPLSEEERMYRMADRLLAEGKYQEAIDIFTSLGDYKDSAERILQCYYLWAEAELEAGELGMAAIRFGKLSDYSDARARSCALWDQIAERDTVSMGGNHTIGIRNDGSPLYTGSTAYGKRDVQNWSDLVAVSVSYYHSVGLVADGTVVATGRNDYGQCDTAGWSDIVAIGAGDSHTVALRMDGTVFATGSNDHGQCEVSGWTDIVGISAGSDHTVGVRADGTVVATGSNEYGECDTSGLSGIIEASAGGAYTLYLKADGTAVARGKNDFGQCNVTNWSDVVSVETGYDHSLGLRSDGTVATAGSNTYGQLSVSGWTGIIDIYASSRATVGLLADGTVLPMGSGSSRLESIYSWTDIRIPTRVREGTT